MFTHDIIKRLAVNSVMLLLYMDLSSYDDAVLDGMYESGGPLITSPLVNQHLWITDLEAVVAGPASGCGSYHVIANMMASGHRISGFCGITCYVDGHALIDQTDIHVDSLQLYLRRNLSLKDGKLIPWALAEDYDLDEASKVTGYAAKIR